jgi:glucosamine-6-phosphate deaminase
MLLPVGFEVEAEELAQASPLPVTVLPDADAVHRHFARALADEVAANNAAGRPTRLILPVGPTLHYPMLADLCNREQISWRDAHLFFMDEYCDWQGRLVDMGHPLSFRGTAQRLFFDNLRAELRPPAEQVHFPDPRNLGAIAVQMAAIGGVDTCYGGIGIHGHVAFNEAPLSRWYTVSIAEFMQSSTRLLPLAEETIVMNAARGVGGYFPALPPMAVTLGMREIAAARRIRLYAPGGVWQRAALRIALFGAPDAPNGQDVRYPVSLLRAHADIAFVTDLETAQRPVSK